MLVFILPTGCKYLKVLKLSQVKVSDEGVRLLLQQPLDHLEELDLSHTLITSWSLQLLPEGGHCMETHHLSTMVFFLYHNNGCSN